MSIQTLDQHIEITPDSLVNQTVAFALNQLSAQKWEVFQLPPDSSQSSDFSISIPTWPGLKPPTPPAPKAGSYEILLRRVIHK